MPQALVAGGTGTLWNPAQRPPTGQASVSLDLVQTPTAVGVNGSLFVGRIRIRPLGEVGLVYGEMAVADLLRTTVSPEPDAGTVPYFAHLAGVNWTATRAGTTVGTTIGLEDTRLDMVREDRARFDIGIAQLLPAGIRIAAAGHLMSRVGADPDHELYAGVEWRLWRGTTWSGSGPGSFVLRSGIAVGHDVSTDYQVGLGLELARQFAADLQLTRQGGYAGSGAWSGSAGVHVRIGRYGVRYARDTGLSDLGSAYRVGLEAQVK